MTCSVVNFVGLLGAEAKNATVTMTCSGRPGATRIDDRRRREASAPSQFSSTPLSGTSTAPGRIAGVGVVAVDAGVEAVVVVVGDGDRPGARTAVASTLPARSIARASKEWAPAARPVERDGGVAGREGRAVEAALERRAGGSLEAELEGLGVDGLQRAFARAEVGSSVVVGRDGVDDEA